MILLVDSYDSFTYNLYQYIKMSTNEEVKVIRNDEMKIDEIIKLDPSKIIFSPGPKTPSEAGNIKEIISSLVTKPILGVCLGHQAINEVFGGTTILAPNLVHGKASPIEIDTKSKLFKGLPSKIMAARYHSLIIQLSTNSPLKVIAKSNDGEIMAIEHTDLKIFGVQFHPESILSEFGLEIIKNFLSVN